MRRPSDLGIRRPGRLGAHPGAAAHGSVQALPGSAGRARRAAQVPGLHPCRRQPQIPRLPRLIVNYETAPGSGIGFLAGWRGKGGEKSMRGEPNPKQWEMYEKNNCVFQHHMPAQLQYMRNWNDDYMPLGAGAGLRREPRSDRHPPLQRIPAALPPRGAKASTRASSRPSACASGCRPISTRCRSTTHRWRSRRPTCRDTRSMP